MKFSKRKKDKMFTWKSNKRKKEEVGEVGRERGKIKNKHKKERRQEKYL